MTLPSVHIRHSSSRPNNVSESVPQNDDSGAMASMGTFPDHEDTAIKGAMVSLSATPTRIQPYRHKCVSPRALPQLPFSGTGHPKGRDHCIVLICFKKHTEVRSSSFQLLLAGFAITELPKHGCEGHRQKDLLRGSCFCCGIRVLSE